MLQIAPLPVSLSLNHPLPTLWGVGSASVAGGVPNHSGGGRGKRADGQNMRVN